MRKVLIDIASALALTVTCGVVGGLGFVGLVHAMVGLISWLLSFMPGVQ